MGRNRIELWGHLVSDPEVRTTPSRMPILRVRVDCGSPLTLEVVHTGNQARELGSKLKLGAEVRVIGTLRAGPQTSRAGLSAIGFEVVATEIEHQG